MEKAVKELQAALSSLKAERDALDRKIEAVQAALGELGAKTKRGPGRPKGSKNSTTKAKATAKGKKRRSPSGAWTEEKKAAAAERMRKYWADRKKKEAKKRKRA